MLIYEKKNEDGTRHLYGTMGQVPSSTDVQLTYKDANGAAVTPVITDSFIDGKGTNKVQKIIDKTQNKDLNVFIGDTCVIGEDTTQRVSAVKKETKTVKKEVVKPVVEQVEEETKAEEPKVEVE